MAQIEPTLCIRCGKPRKLSRTWKEKTPAGMMTYTQSVCEDPECQKLVDKQLIEKQTRLRNIQKLSLDRRMNARKKSQQKKN